MITIDALDRQSWERILPNIFDVSTLQHLGGAALARALLAETGRATGKAQARRQALQEGRETRLRVDTGELHRIIDYAAFKCHPECSVARDEAISGSDIDQGLVVVREPVDQQTELAFTAELKRQGFDVCHPTEAQAAEQEWKEFQAREYDYDKMTTADWQQVDKDFIKLEAGQRLLPLQQISFVTEADIAARATSGPLDPQMAVYLAGYSIE